MYFLRGSLDSLKYGPYSLHSRSQLYIRRFLYLGGIEGFKVGDKGAPRFDHAVWFVDALGTTYVCLVVLTVNRPTLCSASANFFRGVIASRVSTSIPLSRGSLLDSIMAL